ncbi:hypothetical protein ACHAXR_008623 [Thalassiosira sp. AJA248-18]
MVLSPTELTEINTFFESRMAESKKIWATRGKDARAAAMAKKAAEPPTWRQMRGMSLMMHEMGHIGNRPFVVGFAVSAVGALWIQTKFSDEMKASSLYWSTYHGGK